MKRNSARIDTNHTKRSTGEGDGDQGVSRIIHLPLGTGGCNLILRRDCTKTCSNACHASLSCATVCQGTTSRPLLLQVSWRGDATLRARGKPANNESLHDARPCRSVRLRWGEDALVAPGGRLQAEQARTLWPLASVASGRTHTGPLRQKGSLASASSKGKRINTLAAHVYTVRSRVALVLLGGARSCRSGSKSPLEGRSQAHQRKKVP